MRQLPQIKAYFYLSRFLQAVKKRAFFRSLFDSVILLIV